MYTNPETPRVHTVVDGEVVQDQPTKTGRAKSLVKKTFTRVGIPVLAAGAVAYVVSRRTTEETLESDTTLIEE